MKRMILSRLNTVQKKRIEALCLACRQAEPIRLTLPIPQAGTELTDERFFLLYDKGQLVSLIHLFFPDGSVGELIGFTHPDHRRKHYFASLLSLAADYAWEAGLRQIYLISDGRSGDACLTLKALNLSEEYAEYMLVKELIGADAPFSGTPGREEPVGSKGRDSLRVTAASTSPLTAALFSEIFQADREQCEAYLEEISSDEHVFTYVLEQNGLPVGQAQLAKLGDMAYLSGFGILPAYRGRGYGQFFLRELERILAAQSVSRMTLQVSSQNNPALSLYRKDGFLELEALRYYPLY